MLLCEQVATVLLSMLGQQLSSSMFDRLAKFLKGTVAVFYYRALWYTRFHLLMLHVVYTRTWIVI